MKTKPTQHSVMKMREIGIQPDILLCRSSRPMGTALKQKIALFTNVAPDAVFSAEDVDCIYEVPSKFHKQGVDEKIAELLNIWSRAPGTYGLGTGGRAHEAARSPRSRSPWSASTSICSNRTRASTRPSYTAESLTTAGYTFATSTRKRSSAGA